VVYIALVRGRGGAGGACFGDFELAGSEYLGGRGRVLAGLVLLGVAVGAMALLLLMMFGAFR